MTYLYRSDHWSVENDGTLFYYNGAKCGSVYKEVDGFYHWTPPERPGAWGASNLREVADLLDYMNTDWYETIRRELG